MSDDLPPDERTDTDRAAADRSEADRPDENRPDADRPDADRPDADRPDDAGRRLEALLAEHRDPPDQEAEVADESDFDPFAPAPGAVATDRPGDSDDDGARPDTDDDALPEAPLFALLRNVQEDVGIDRIDRIWIFPPRRQGSGETSVVVVAAFHDTDADRRRVYAAHYTAHTDATEPRLALDEFGTAPNDRVARLVEEVLERIKDGPAGAPRSYDIGGREGHWHRVLHQLAEAHLEETRRDPRLRR